MDKIAVDFKRCSTVTVTITLEDLKNLLIKSLELPTSVGHSKLYMAQGEGGVTLVYDEEVIQGPIEPKPVQGDLNPQVLAFTGIYSPGTK